MCWYLSKKRKAPHAVHVLVSMGEKNGELSSLEQGAKRRFKCTYLTMFSSCSRGEHMQRI